MVLPELPPFADLFKVKLEPNNRESQENICENSPRGSGGVETIEICLSGEFSLPRNAVKQKLLRAGVRVIDFFKQKVNCCVVVFDSIRMISLMVMSIFFRPWHYA